MLTVPAVFIAGILAFLSPCFLPVVPVFVAQMTGVRKPTSFIGQDQPTGQLLSSAGGHVDTAVLTVEPQVTVHQGCTRQTRWAAARQALVFVAAFSIVFAGLWAAIGIVGWIVGDIRRYLSIIAGAILILLGLHMARLIRIPFLDRTFRHEVSNLSGGPSYKKSALLGLSFGAGWSPCIGPILGGVVALATVQSTVAAGFGLLLVFCAGLGAPFVVSAVLADRLISFSWAKKHYQLIELVLGFSLVAVGFLMISGLLERLAATVPTIM